MHVWLKNIMYVTIDNTEVITIFGEYLTISAKCKKKKKKKWMGTKFSCRCLQQCLGSLKWYYNL